MKTIVIKTQKEMDDLPGEFFLNNQLANTKTVFCIKQMELK